MSISLSSFGLGQTHTRLFGLLMVSFLTSNSLAYAETVSQKKSPPAIEAKLSAQLVTIKNGKPTFSSANKVAPGDIIKYDITYKNVSKNPISGIIVEGPIPNGTRYISDSAGSNLKSKNLVKFEVSVDDSGKWAVPPVYRMIRQSNGTMKSMEIPVSEYKKIRWVLSEPIKAKNSNIFSYWVKVSEKQEITQ